MWCPPRKQHIRHSNMLISLSRTVLLLMLAPLGNYTSQMHNLCSKWRLIQSYKLLEGTLYIVPMNWTQAKC